MTKKKSEKQIEWQIKANRNQDNKRRGTPTFASVRLFSTARKDRIDSTIQSFKTKYPNATKKDSLMMAYKLLGDKLKRDPEWSCPPCQIENKAREGVPTFAAVRLESPQEKKQLDETIAAFIDRNPGTTKLEGLICAYEILNDLINQ